MSQSCRRSTQIHWSHVRLAGALYLCLMVVACLQSGCTASIQPPSEHSPVGSVEQDPPASAGKRGAAFHFCGWPFSKGEADLRALVPGLSWYYNWSSKPLECPDGMGVAGSPMLADGLVEFVPMAWGLVNDGTECEKGGPCFRVDERSGGTPCKSVCEKVGWSFHPESPCYACYHEGISREAFLKDIPAQAKHLLGYNEPNFKEQANLTPRAAAKGWVHLEWVAQRANLTLVGPATNFCDPTPGVVHPGSCIDAVEGDTMLGLAWLEKFYDECSEDGAAGRNCTMEYQAVHAYNCDNITWMIELMKSKAGLVPPLKEHCVNGRKDEDEFGTDCGGNVCPACSAHAREMFRKPVWLTEFATPKDDCGGGTREELVERTLAFMREELPKLDQDPYVYRYAWFMPKVDMATLDHTDLLREESGGVLSPLGKYYLRRESP